MGHSMAYYEGSIILYGGVSDNSVFEDDKFYSLNLESRVWTIILMTGVKPGYRVNHSMCFFKSNQLVIFGGKHCIDRSGEYIVSSETYFIDLKESNSMMLFIAGVGPSARFGHRSANNKDELIILGGLDNVYCPMDIFVLKEVELNSQVVWMYEQMKHFNGPITRRQRPYIRNSKKYYNPLQKAIGGSRTEEHGN